MTQAQDKLRMKCKYKTVKDQYDCFEDCDYAHTEACPDYIPKTILEKEMTQDFREKIAEVIKKVLVLRPNADTSAIPFEDFWSIELSNEISALIQESLPALAKEAGYKSLEEVSDILAKYLAALKEAGYVKLPGSMEITELAEIIYNLHMGIKEIKGSLQSFLLTNHYVKLAKDQTLPNNPYFKTMPPTYGDYGGYSLAQQDMLKAGWRKVQEE